MEARVRYLAIVSEQPEELVRYYRGFYGLRELGRSPEGDVSLTDGFYNLTILRRRAELGADADRPGLRHIGIQVDDLREVEGRLEDHAPAADIRPEPGGLHHGQYRLVAPDGLPVSLSTSGFGTPDDRRGLPAIHHVAVKTADPEALLGFYGGVFGFREVSSSLQRRKMGWESRFAGDGSTSLALLPLGQQEEAPGNITRTGVNHFGFVVADMEDMLRRLPAGQTDRRPATRLQAEYRTFDPDHNGIDISQTAGFEVDVDRWARAEG
jgi:catechol 2,3-dioxygenase-like lactoylglutathione lyase family enzyme